MKERLKVFIDYCGLNVKQFEIKCGLSNGIVSHLTQSLRGDMIVKVAKTFPELSLDWLIMGRGEMIRNETCTKGSLSFDEAFYKNQIEQKDKQITFLMSLLEKNKNISQSISL